MCGRYVNVAASGELVRELALDEVVGDDPGPSWNIAPTDPVRVVLERAPHPDDADAAVVTDHGRSAADGAAARRQLRTVRWGLVPSWSRDARGGARMINARIETVTTKPAFAKAAARRRCLVPAAGYYEWQQTDHGKVPYFLHDPDGRLLTMAGLYELWRDPDRADDDPERWRWTCTIITQQAPDLLGEIHDRNPVVVPPELRDAWLDCTRADVDVAADLLARIPPARLEPYRVSPAVGNVRTNGPELVVPVDEGAPGRDAPTAAPRQDELPLPR